MSLRDKTARPLLTNYPSAELKNYLKQHPTTATSPTCTSALEPMSIGADGCSQDAVIKVGDTVEVQCEDSYRAEVMSVRGEEVTIKVLDNPAKGSWTGAPLSALKKIEVEGATHG